jgi:phosphonate transport system substrate-binding protein
MYKLFTPLLESLQDDVSARLSRPVDIELRIFRTYDDGINSLVEGSVDFVHFGPASYIVAKGKQPKLQLLAMEHENGEKRFKGVIVVAKNSPIKTIEDLRGRRFAFCDRNSTIGRYLVQALLVEHGIHASDLPGSKYLERHDQVAAAVEHGDFDAGSVKVATFLKANEKGTLRKLAEFDNVTKPLVARAGLDDATFAAIQQSLIEFKDLGALKALKISGFMAAADSDYDFVREGMKKSAEFDVPAPVPQPER